MTVVGRSRPLSWGSTPYSVGGGRKGLLVLGREEKIGDDLLKFMMELAWHFGKMEEAFERLRAS